MALKGKQKKLDKNNNGRIDAEDFKILQASKKGMRMGGMMGYGAARTSGMGLQDESIKPGKVMKAKSGKLSSTGKYIKRRLELGGPKTIGLDPMDVGITTASGITAGAGLAGAGTILNKARKQAKKKEMMKKSKKMTASEGSFRVGGLLKARSGKLADAMKKLREKAYEKSGKKYKGVGRFGKDEYMIQKKLPGMRTGKMVDKKDMASTLEILKRLESGKPVGAAAARAAMKANPDRFTDKDIERVMKAPKMRTGKAVETLKVIPTVKGRKQIAKDFSPSEKNKKTNKYKDYK